jgi:signal transduction histidine kinase/ActR/RegA family two-component response regulator
MTSLPLRYQIAIVLVGLTIGSTGVLAIFAYRASRRALEEQALRAVGVVAEARETAVVRLLSGREERLNAFLATVESLCGERASRGRLSFEPQCVRTVLRGFRAAEGATAVELVQHGRLLATRGRWQQPREGRLMEGRLATLIGEHHRDYTMQGTRGQLVVRAQLPLADIEAIFHDRSGLEANGDVFLVDSNGSFLTDGHDRGSAVPVQPVTAAFTGCLAGTPTQLLTHDYSGQLVIEGLHPIPGIGGGCVIANLPYESVLIPIRRLGKQFMYASAAFIMIGITLSFIVAQAVAQPIARLSQSARGLAAGHFAQVIRIGGPSEVRQLETTFTAMAKSIADLLHREHAARIEAESANRLKDEFLATVSHELRTPLNAILGWGSIVSTVRLDAERTRHAMDAIVRNARMQAGLIDELLDVSRMVNGQMRLTVIPVSLGRVIEAAIDTVRPAAEAKGLELVVDVPPLARQAAGDAARLQQIVWNLLSNAVRFTPSGGRVAIALREEAGQAAIEVTDTGIGLAPAFVPHVFERFRQADSSTTRTHGGLGLGLAIVRHLVELHGGSVHASSGGEGCGATFTVRLPLWTEVPAVAASAGAPGPRDRQSSTLRGTRVLVVDDDEEAREILRTLLEDAGAIVTATASARETRAILGEVHPDLLIADIGMPEEDGYALMRSVRASEAGGVTPIPAIALTAWAREEDVANALAAGFQRHVAKPVDAAHLVSTVAMLVSVQT